MPAGLVNERDTRVHPWVRVGAVVEDLQWIQSVPTPNEFHSACNKQLQTSMTGPRVMFLLG